MKVLKEYRYAEVILFKESGKYYTSEYWAIPDHREAELGPHGMRYSENFRRTGGGAVLIPSQEPWGFPWLFNPAEDDDQ